MPFVKQEFYIQEKIHAFVFIMRQLGVTQGEAQRVIDRARLLVDGRPMIDKSAKISGSVEVINFLPITREQHPIFVTKDFLVFDKPSGVLVHPNTMHTPYSVLDEIRYHSGQNANAVHRIDQETSGLVLASRHKKAETFLKQSFEHKRIKKVYLAWVDGYIEDDFEVEAPIRINHDYSKTKHKVFIDSNAGKIAKTMFKVVEYAADINSTLLRCYPVTGRTHQIRVHLFHVKHPILGDPIYTTTFNVTSKYLEGELSEAERIRYTGAPRLLLHALSLSFEYKNRYYIESKFDFESLKKDIVATRELDY